MRLHGLFCGLAVAAWTNGAAALNPAAIETANLSTCGTDCTTSVLASHFCTNNDPCFCDNTTIRAQIFTCLDKCPFSDRFYFSAARAKICDTPVQSQGSTLSGTAYALVGLATVFTFTRLASRWTTFGGDGYWWDDYAAILAFPFLIAFTAGQALAVRDGTGQDVWGIASLDDFKGVLYWNYVSGILWTPIVFFTKISMLILYLRLWSSATRFRSFCLLSLGFLLMGYFVFQVVSIAQCSPTNYFWNRIDDARLVEAHLQDAAQGSCINQTGWLWASSVLMIVFDLIIALLPAVKLWEASMSRMTIIGVVTTYLFGLVVLASGFARFAYINNLSDARAFGHFDLTAIVEANMSQICCCIPALSALFNPGQRRHDTHRDQQRSSPFSRLDSLLRYAKPAPSYSGRETPDNEKPPTSAKSFWTFASSSPISRKNSQTPRQYITSNEPVISAPKLLNPEDAERARRLAAPSPIVFATNRCEEESVQEKRTAQNLNKHLLSQLSAAGPFLPGDEYTTRRISTGRSGSIDADTALPPPLISRGPSPALVLPSKRETRWSGISSISASSGYREIESRARISEEGEDSDAALPPPISRGPSPAMIGMINNNRNEQRLSGSRLGTGGRSRRSFVRSPSPLPPRISEDDSDSNAIPPSISRGPSPMRPPTSRQERRLSGQRAGAGSRQSVRAPSLFASPPLGDDSPSSSSESEYSSDDEDAALPPPSIARGPSPLPGAARSSPRKSKASRKNREKQKRISALRITRPGAQGPTLSNPHTMTAFTSNEVSASVDTAVPPPLFARNASPSGMKRTGSLREKLNLTREDRVRGPAAWEDHHPPRISATDDEALGGDERFDDRDRPAQAPIVPRMSSPEPHPFHPYSSNGRPGSRTNSLRHSAVGVMQSLGLASSSSGSVRAGRDGSAARPMSSASARGSLRISDDDVAAAVEEGREKRMSGMVGVGEFISGGGIGAAGVGKDGADLVPFARNGKGVETGRTEGWVRGMGA